VGLAGWAVVKYTPTVFLEILVMVALGLGVLMIGGWATGKRRWGIFLTILLLGLPVLFRIKLLNLASFAIWLLILGLISLIN